MLAGRPRAPQSDRPGPRPATTEDWGIPYTSPDYTDAWLAEGGTPYVLEQIVDGFAGAGASARITCVHGAPDARAELLAALVRFTDEHPECDAELRRFAMETRQNPTTE